VGAWEYCSVGVRSWLWLGFVTDIFSVLRASKQVCIQNWRSACRVTSVSEVSPEEVVLFLSEDAVWLCRRIARKMATLIHGRREEG
jgi:hypothetical protein